MTLFYAWCRVIDDLADDPGPTVAARREALDRWRAALLEPSPGESPLAAPVRALIAKYTLDPALFHELIAGVEMDLAGAAYETWEDLRLYCYRVASVVGLISIEIFGYRDPACKIYAVELGLALQLTNILRDVGEDFANGGRIYLPRADLERFRYTPEDLAAGRRTPEFLALMQFEADRATEHYRRALAALPAVDHRAMAAAEIMRAVYFSLLQRMRADGFQVFGFRYALSSWEKFGLILRTLLNSRFGKQPLLAPEPIRA